MVGRPGNEARYFQLTVNLTRHPSFDGMEKHIIYIGFTDNFVTYTTYKLSGLNFLLDHAFNLNKYGLPFQIQPRPGNNSVKSS